MALANWPDAPRLVEFLHNNPDQVAAALTAVLTQEQVDALHAQLFPPATNPHKTRVLGDIRTELLRAGYDAASTPVAWIDAELAAIAGT